MTVLSEAARTQTPPRYGDRVAALAMLRRGDLHHFIQAAAECLNAGGADPELSMLLVRTLGALGLGGPAREALQARSDLDEREAQTLRSQLRSIPIGRVPWSEFAMLHEANLAALFESRDDLVAMRPALDAATGDLHLFRCARGHLHLTRRATGALREWIIVSPWDPELRDLELPAAEQAAPVMIVGLTLDRRVERVHEMTTASPGASQPVFVVEPSLEKFAAWLHVADRTPVLRDHRVVLFAGPSALADYEQFIGDNDDIQPSGVHVTAPAPAITGTAIEAANRRVIAGRDERTATRVRAIADRSATRTPAQWARRLGEGGRVLGITSRFTTMLQYSMRDIGHALEDLGRTFRLVTEADDYRVCNPAMIARHVEAFDPALVILINHFRHELPDPLSGVPVLTWIQDPMETVLSSATGRSLGPVDFVCGYYQQRCTEQFDYPIARFLPAPIPVSTRVFHPGDLDEKGAAEVACDIMYVGHLHEPPDALASSWKTRVPSSVHPLLARLRDDVVAAHERGEHYRGGVAHVQACAVELGIELSPAAAAHVASYFAGRLYDTLYRRQTLCWAAQWARRTSRAFRIYGRGWDADPELAPFAAGPIEHGEPLRRAYRGARLVLQTLPTGFTHQRTYEGIASGSLVVSRYAPEMFAGLSPEAFARADTGGMNPSTPAIQFPTLGNVVFRDAREMEDLCDRLLADNDERRHRWSHLHEVVLRRYTYGGVVGRIVDWLGESLAAAGDPAAEPAP